MKFVIEQSNEYLTTHSGLTFVGALIAKTDLKKRLDKSRIPGVYTPNISHGDVATSYIGLLCQGKSDFDHIEPFREDDFFAISLNVTKVPSSPTLRQRLDMAGKNEQWKQIILEESAKLLSNDPVQITPIFLGANKERQYVPLDIDVSPFDNSGTKKQGVSRTYKGYDGYAPIFAYLGQEGYCINEELRQGKDHCQNGTTEFLAKTIKLSRMATSLPLLIRMDSGNDSKDNIKICLTPETKVDFIIKRNLRKENPEDWLEIAEKEGIGCQERKGKTVYMGERMVNVKGIETPVRLVYKVIKRTIKADGQVLLFPEIEVDTYWTSLPDPAYKIVELYQDHGTSEQFHSEIKTDMDLERLPSGHFTTNELVLCLGGMAYNILRIIGQESIKKSDAPLRKKAQRRRIRTVIQNLITLASRMVYHARKYKLRFGCHSPWFITFKRIALALN